VQIAVKVQMLFTAVTVESPCRAHRIVTVRTVGPFQLYHDAKLTPMIDPPPLFNC